jgi:hypothetical protein
MVTEPEYPDGMVLFTYTSPERMTTICLTHPKDGSPPPTLEAMRSQVDAEIQRRAKAVEPPDDFLAQWLDALDRLILSRGQSALPASAPATASRHSFS